MIIAQTVLDMIAETKEASSHLRSFSEEEIETLYASAYHMYNQGNYNKSSELFLQLTASNPYEESYWRGLASAYQMQSLWEESLHAWALCALLKEQDPLPHYHAAECLYSQKETEEALKALAQAKLRASGDEALLSKIQLLQELAQGKVLC